MPEERIKKNKKFLNIDQSAVVLPRMNIDFRTSRNGLSIEIGEASMVGCNFIFESEGGFIKIGKRTFINEGTNLISRNYIEIGNDVTIGWGCYIYDHNSHSLNWEDRIDDIKNVRDDYLAGRSFIYSKDWSNVKSAPIKICDRAWIGFDALIMKGVTVGEGAIVAAKSVVTKDVSPWTIVAGNPARIVKNIDH